MTEHEQPTPARLPDQDARLQRPAGAGEQTDPPPAPSIWVAATADTPSGTWWDASGTAEQLRVLIGEGAVFRTVGFGSFTVEQYDDPETIAAVANGIRAHGEAFAAWAELHDADPNMLPLFSAHYVGHFESLTQFGRELVSGAALALPERLVPYVRIDYEALAEAEIRRADCISLPAEQNGFYLFLGPDAQPPSLDSG